MSALAMDRWVQRVTLAAVLGLAAAVLGLGIALYSPAQAAPAREAAATDFSTLAAP